MNINFFFEQLIAGENLTNIQIHQVMKACMSGQLTDAQIATFLALMRMKGETPLELTAAATVMMEFARYIDLGDDLIDIVGTGGDKKNTFNVSTISSFVAAAAGAKVAKHGNRAVSSSSGSADFLLQAGFILELTDDQLLHCMQQCGICFLFAPHFHQAMRYARNARQQIGIPTLFNLLGPLANPARPKKQIIGVSSSRWVEPITQVLANLGSQHTFVIHSRDGMDEISIAALTDVAEYKNGRLTHWTINPKDYDCFHPTLDAIIVDAPTQSLALAKTVFDGQPGAARDIVLLNSALAIYCAGIASSFALAIESAKKTIDSGEASARFEQLKQLTRQIAAT